MAVHDPQRLQRLLGGDALTQLRSRLRKRYRDGAPPADQFTLANLDTAEADALAGLLGRKPRPRASLRLSHSELDAVLQRAGIAADLKTALEWLDGPIANPRAEQERLRRSWAEAFAAVEHPDLAGLLRRPPMQGLVKRLAHSNPAAGRKLLADSERVLAALPAGGTALAQLAANTLGDAHALDRGRPVATLVLRVLGQRDSVDRPRDLWAGQGVLVNELAKPVATLNLTAGGTGSVAQLVHVAAASGAPLHLSLRQLTRDPPRWQTRSRIHVCENPAVLAAAADAHGVACPPMISLDGQLSAAPRMLLDQLAAQGARFCYHGDFDWGGLRIANHFFARYAAMPWRYNSSDYQPTDGPLLQGHPVAADWDAELAVCMERAGIAIHEESRLHILLEDLAHYRDQGP